MAGDGVAGGVGQSGFGGIGFDGDRREEADGDAGQEAGDAASAGQRADGAADGDGNSLASCVRAGETMGTGRGCVGVSAALSGKGP